MRTVLTAIAIAIASASSMPAAARDLAVPAEKGWQHAQTSIVLRQSIAGMPRVGLADGTNGEFDITANFMTPDRKTFATVFIFQARPASVPIWFDRAETAIANRQLYGGVQPLAPPLAFARPGGGTASGLRRAYKPGKRPFIGTALATLPVGGWVVVVRVSSETLDAAATDAKLSEVIAAIGWPKGPATSPAATPLAACPTPLTFAKAKPRKPDMMQAVLGGVLGAAAKPTDQAAVGAYCSDAAEPVEWGVYRPTGTIDGYTLALADAGRSVGVYKSIEAAGLPGGYAVTLFDVDGSSSTYPHFDKLPKPEQVLDFVRKTTPLARSEAGNTSISINSALEK